MKLEKICTKIEEFIKNNNLLLQIGRNEYSFDENGNKMPTDFVYYVEKGKDIKDKKILGLFLWVIFFDLPRWSGVAAINMYSTRKTGKEEDIVIRERKVTLSGKDLLPDDISSNDLERIKKEVKLISDFIDTLNIPTFKTNPAEGLNQGKKYNECISLFLDGYIYEYIRKSSRFTGNDISIRISGAELYYLAECNKKHGVVDIVDTFFYNFEKNKAITSKALEDILEKGY
jgi:hypothetical protein